MTDAAAPASLVRPANVHDFCVRILESGELSDKLLPPVDGAIEMEGAAPAVSIDHPARSAAIALATGSEPLPRPGALEDPSARAQCLARFAHHELMAVELFAWALLRWPEVPTALRVGWLGVLAEEQQHCALYLERLAAHGHALSDFKLSDYFWKHVPAISASPEGPAAFLSAMGLTLEQANLDFTLVYRDAFRAAGDEESARVCQKVHDEEIAHVGLAARWLRELRPESPDDIARYQQSVPFPLSPARAKGRRFDRDARRRAGLSEEFIEFVRTARSSQQERPQRQANASTASTARDRRTAP